MAAVSDSAGGTVETYAYSVYGQVQVTVFGGAGTGNPYMFTGRRLDAETGLYYYRARLYSPYIGRFLQTDPIGYADGINWYLYCGNNPLILVDPWGLCGRSVAYGDWGAWAKEFAVGFWEGLGEGIDLTAHGASFGVLGDDARIASLRRKYPVAARVSQIAGGTASVALGSAVAVEALGVNVTLWGSSAATSTIATGDVSVYRSISNGATDYVGITNNLARRGGEQLRARGVEIEAIRGLERLSRADARAVEQVLIEHHGLMNNAGTLMNKINAIAAGNPIYRQAIERGSALLSEIGYPGFGGG